MPQVVAQRVPGSGHKGRFLSHNWTSFPNQSQLHLLNEFASLRRPKMAEVKVGSLQDIESNSAVIKNGQGL